MKAIFDNRCSRNVYLSINNSEIIDLPACQKTMIELPGQNQIQVIVKQDLGSRAEKKKGNKNYRIAVETSYTAQLCGADVCFVVSREVIRVSGNAYYEKIHLFSSDCQILSEDNRLTDTKSVVKEFSKSNIIYNLLVSPIECYTGFVIGALILSVILGVKFGVLYGFGAFICSYIIIYVIDRVMEKSINWFSKEVFSIDDSKAEFALITSNEFVSDYFKNADRDAYMNDRTFEI